MRLWRYMVLLVTLTLVVLIRGTVAVTEELIWQERWLQAGRDFQIGYAVAIDDLADVLLDLEVGSRWQANQGYSERVPTALRKAHQCLRSPTIPFTTIEQTTQFVDQVMTTANDPQESVGERVFASFVSCDPKL